MQTIRYHNLSSYLKERYGEPVGKICIDGGFTCPNRDGTCGFGGCIFCGERGSGEHIDPTLSIREQVEKGLNAPGKRNKFIAYFQNFTNTYAPVSVLKERYAAALFDRRIVALAVGTRPDCITEEIADLLASYRAERDVWVELGFQTANDEVAKIFNRGYDHTVFERAMKILAERNLPVVVHVMLGLPGQPLSDAADTAKYLSRFSPFGVKIHCVYVMENTKLSDLYRAGNYTPITEKDYVAGVGTVLSLLPPQTVIHRLTGDCPEGALVAPLWNSDKNRILSLIRDYMESHSLYQGCKYEGERHGN